MDVQGYINKIVTAVKEDDGLLAQFKKEPIQAVEKVLGVDLPDELIEKIIDGVKAKITVDNAKDALGALKKLF